jgi:hypothetical protein
MCQVKQVKQELIEKLVYSLAHQLIQFLQKWLVEPYGLSDKFLECLPFPAVQEAMASTFKPLSLMIDSSM